jgi:hypothetical protein
MLSKLAREFFLPSGFAIVMAENPAGVHAHVGVIPGKRLCELVGSILYIYPTRIMGRPVPEIQFVVLVAARSFERLRTSCQSHFAATSRLIC